MATRITEDSDKAMEMKTTRTEIENASGDTDKWILLIAVCARLFFFGGSLKSNGVILDDLVEYLGTTHSLVAWAFSLQNALAFSFAPVTRMLLLVVSHRKLCVAGGVLVGLGYVYCGIFATSVIHLFIGFGLSGIGFGLIMLPSYLALQRLFGDKFPTASAFSGMFSFIGMASLPPLMKYLVTMYGLRSSMTLLGALLWNLIACGVTVRMPPERIEPHEVQTKPMIQIIYEKDTEKEQNPTITRRQSSVIQRHLPFCSSIFAHRNFAALVVYTCANDFVFTSWVIFLVSFGKSVGLSSELAVFLSTAGGLGGLVGRSTGMALFHFDWHGPYVYCFPTLLSGLLLLCSVIASNFVILSSITLLCGFTQGLSISMLYGALPLTVCSYHLPQATAMVCFMDGIMIQCAGVVSGLIHDIFGSSIYVFGFDAVICFVVAPVMFAWSSSEQGVKDCKPEPRQDHKESHN